MAAEPPRNPYGEALAALDQLKQTERPISFDADVMEQAALVKATEAAALASLAAADASYAARDAAEELATRLRESSR